MKGQKFILNDFMFTLKTQKFLFILTLALFLFFFLMPLSRFNQEGLSPETANAMLAAVLPMLTIPLAIFIPMMATEAIDREKNDRVLEHLLALPVSPLKFLWYRFISMCLVVVLLTSMCGFLMYLIMTLYFGYNALAVLGMYAASIVCAIPITYVLTLTSLVVSRRYVGLLRIFVLISIAVLPSSLIGAAQVALDQTFFYIMVYMVILIVLGLYGVIATITWKDKLAERTIFSM